MLNNYVKKLLLSTMVLVIGNNSNYCYGMEIEKEINNSSNHDNNSMNTINEQRIINANQNNNEDYKHLFDINYNKHYYDKVCNECINNVNNNKKEYKVFMEMVSQVFDNIISRTGIKYNINKKDLSFLKFQEIIAFDNLKNFSKVFDSISLTKSTKKDKLLDNNNSFLLSQLTEYNKNTKNYIMFNKQLTQKEKYIRINKLVDYRELSPVEVLIYIQNSIRKLKSQVMKELEYSIFHSYENININNEKIIKEAQQILGKIHKLYYKEVFNWILYKNSTENSQNSYNAINHIQESFEKYIARLDIFHYNGSNLNIMFDNLHTKIMATLDKVINDIDNNKLRNVEIIIPNVYKYYSELVDNIDSNYIKTLFDDFDEVHKKNTKLRLKKFLEKFKEKLKEVKRLTNRKIKQQIDKYYTLLDYDLNGGNFTIYNYMLITISVMQSLTNNAPHLKSKQLVQCRDFLEAFNNYYWYITIPDLYTWTYILKYNAEQSPKETLKEVLLNNNDNFDLKGNNVNNLILDINCSNYSFYFLNSSDFDSSDFDSSDFASSSED